MQKSEGAVTRLSEIEGLERLAGADVLDTRGRVPFDPLAVEFLSELSGLITQSARARPYSDVVSFGFWCRQGNLLRMKRDYPELEPRLGRGLALHIAPANVPVNFAFSFAFGLLAGNANLVRLPSRAFAQVDVLTSLIAEVLARPRFAELAAANAFVRYASNDAITTRLSLLANARLLWGGDATVEHLRQLPSADRCVDLLFSDRYSISVLDAAAVLALDEAALAQLARMFFNDTYAMDQNACSSPSFVAWLGKANARAAASRFFSVLTTLALEKYEIQPMMAVDKYTQLCNDAIELDLSHVVRDTTALYRVGLQTLEAKHQLLRGRFGYFYEYDIDTPEQLEPLMGAKCQTLTTFGVEQTALQQLVIDRRWPGVDRIVPVGSALEMSLHWDGYDLIRSLSRVIA